jgi:hypothetical protein
MQKGQEREFLKRHEEMPLSRNEKRQLGDGSKAAEQTIARAARRGQLISRSQAQLVKRVGKVHSEVHKAVALVQERRALSALTAELESPARSIHASNALAGSELPGAGGASGAAAAGASEDAAGASGAAAGGQE